MDLLKEISNLGLTDKEAHAYITLAKLGPSASATLAKAIGANRTSMYDILARLEEKGLILSIRKNKTTFYVIDDFSKLVQREKQQVRAAEEVVKALSSQYTVSSIAIKYYIGEEGLKELYNSILESGEKMLYVWANSVEFFKALESTFVQEWIQQRVKKGIHTKMIQTKDDISVTFRKQDKDHNREIRFAKNYDLTFTSVCYIFAHSIVLFDTQGKTVGLRIDNPELATMFRQIFEFAWTSAE